MSTALVWIISLLAMLAGAALGVVFESNRRAKQARAQRHLPRNAAITARPMVNSRERRVWRWLSRLFGDHYVMVKVPVTRFTLPVGDDSRDQWFALLADVYCTFTVVNVEGKVLGCVDVAVPGGLSKSNLQVKRFVFTRCNVPHWVVDPDQLPKDQDIFNAFIPMSSDAENLNASVVNPSEIQKAHAELKAAVNRSRKAKDDSSSARDRAGDESVFADTDLGADWAPDSFNGPLDSRAADLPRF